MAISLVGLINELGIQQADFIPFAPDMDLEKICDVAVELMNIGANYLREHVLEKARIHYVITDGGKAPNIVPDSAEVWYYVRAPKRVDVRKICTRLNKIAQGAAMMTETAMEYEIGCWLL